MVLLYHGNNLKKFDFLGLTILVKEEKTSLLSKSVIQPRLHRVW